MFQCVDTEIKEVCNEYADPQVKRSALSVKCRAARRPAYFFWNIFLITVSAFGLLVALGDQSYVPVPTIYAPENRRILGLLDWMTNGISFLCKKVSENLRMFWTLGFLVESLCRPRILGCEENRVSICVTR